jgi:acetyltransferase
VGGVRLDLAWDEVRNAFATMEKSVSEKFAAADFLGVTVQPMLKLNDGYELIVGSSPDPQFGPVLLFGTGGTLVEVFKDRALAIPPLNTTLARLTMSRTKIYEALKGVRGRPPVDLALLDKIFVRFSELVVSQRWIKEIDINRRSRRMAAFDWTRGWCSMGGGQEEDSRLAIRLPVELRQEFINREGLDFTLADSPGRRAEDGRLPREAVGAERVLALLPRLQPGAADGA